MTRLAASLALALSLVSANSALAYDLVMYANGPGRYLGVSNLLSDLDGMIGQTSKRPANWCRHYGFDPIVANNKVQCLSTYLVSFGSQKMKNVIFIFLLGRSGRVYSVRWTEPPPGGFNIEDAVAVYHQLSMRYGRAKETSVDSVYIWRTKTRSVTYALLPHTAHLTFKAR